MERKVEGDGQLISKKGKKGKIIEEDRHLKETSRGGVERSAGGFEVKKSLSQTTRGGRFC